MTPAQATHAAAAAAACRAPAATAPTRSRVSGAFYTFMPVASPNLCAICAICVTAFLFASRKNGMVVVSKGESVWYDPQSGGEFDLPIGGLVMAADAGQIQVKLATGEVRPAPDLYHRRHMHQHSHALTSSSTHILHLCARAASPLQEKWIPAAEHGQIHNMHQSSVEGCDDMISLGDLHEGAILHNLSIRYKDPNMCNIYVSEHIPHRCHQTGSG